MGKIGITPKPLSTAVDKINEVDGNYFLCDGPVMAYTVPPPATRPEYATILKKLRKNNDIFLPAAKIDSIKAIASRLGQSLERKFITRKEDGGVRVWRLQ